MKIIAGLGNPGPQYRHTRHNVGFMVLDDLAHRLGAAFSQEKYRGLLAQGKSLDEPVILIKPLTYMNNSGECVTRIVRYRNIDVADLLVVVDDVNLPLGKIRIRTGGTSGGHNGLKSIADHLGTEDFARVRLGIGRDLPGGELTEYVLGDFTHEERPVCEEMVAHAADAALCFVADGIAQAMNRFNTPPATRQRRSGPGGIDAPSEAE